MSSLAQHWEEVNPLAAGATYVDNRKYEFGFTANVIQIHYRAGTNPVYYSLDGKNDHGVLSNASGYLQTQILQPTRSNQIWLRNGSGDEVLEIMAQPSF
jgi:hypothetical protein